MIVISTRLAISSSVRGIERLLRESPPFRTGRMSTNEHPRKTRPSAPPTPASRCAAYVRRLRLGQIQYEEISRGMPPECRRRRASRECPTPRPPASTGAPAAHASTLLYLRACTVSDSPSGGADRPPAALGRRHRAYPRPPPQTPLAPPRSADSEIERCRPAPRMRHSPCAPQGSSAGPTICAFARALAAARSAQARILPD